MEITKIQKQRKKNNRYNIFVDNKYVFSISGNDLLKTHIKKGPINKEKLQKVQDIASIGTLYEYSLIYEAIRLHSLLEHKNYLYKKAQHLDIEKEKRNKYIKKALDKLIENGYQDDKNFTTWFIEQRIKSPKPKGTISIKKELQKKGISPDLIKECTESLIDIETETQNAQILANKKIHQLQNSRNKLSDKEIREKVTRYLLSRGYAYNVIKCLQLI